MSLPVVTAMLAALAVLAGCQAAGEGQGAPARPQARQAREKPEARPSDSEVQTPVRPAKENSEQAKPSMPPLSDEEKRIIVNKGTELPFTGKYWDHFEPGVYVCRQCGAELYASTGKFRSECGWPSFDDEIARAVQRRPDADGRRTEILCAACGGHLGHIFEGEGFTPRNVRHCVNSASIVFRPEGQDVAKGARAAAPATAPARSAEADAALKPATREAVFAGGCFWGVEHLFEQVEGVLDAASGYTGGTVPNPTYQQVCTGRTGHAEAVRVVFDPGKVSYETLARLFFEIHDPTQKNRQGPDVGTQYRSAVFYRDAGQKETAEKLIAELKALGYDVATEVAPAKEFYPAEDYHQDYLLKHPDRPVCHSRVRRFQAPPKS